MIYCNALLLFRHNNSAELLGERARSTGVVCGRSLTAGKILFTEIQTCSLYSLVVLWLCGRTTCSSMKAWVIPINPEEVSISSIIFSYVLHICKTPLYCTYNFILYKVYLTFLYSAFQHFFTLFYIIFINVHVVRFTFSADINTNLNPTFSRTRADLSLWQGWLGGREPGQGTSASTLMSTSSETHRVKFKKKNILSF